MASELRVNTLKDAAGNNSIATSFVAGGSAKAWFNYNGSGTIAYRDSFNCASLTDHATGDHSVNFTSSMTSDDYSSAGIVGNGNDADTSNSQMRRGTSATGSIRLTINYANGGTTALFDYSECTGNINGDLA
tara:strand:+ start:270 stop:665 length:396 start_codon:yes stop_codon:yes gene_type:complete